MCLGTSYKIPMVATFWVTCSNNEKLVAMHKIGALSLSMEDAHLWSLVGEKGLTLPSVQGVG